MEQPGILPHLPSPHLACHPAILSTNTARLVVSLLDCSERLQRLRGKLRWIIGSPNVGTESSVPQRGGRRA